MEVGFHPVCLLFPPMSEPDLQELADDIKAHGQLNDILRWDGQIWDGRSRFEACKLAGVEPKFRDLTDEPCIEDLISLNVKRRHLTQSQRAMLATELLPYLEAEAAKRIEETQFKTDAEYESNGVKSAGVDTVSTPETKGVTSSSDKAAKAFKVGKTLVKRAKKLKAKSPELAAKVSAGETTIGQAEKESKEPEAWKPKKDKHGTPIPKHLESKFQHDEKYRQFHDFMAKVGMLVLELGRAKMLPANDVQFCRTSLGNVSTKLKKTRPYLVCTKCDGKACGKCNQRGYTTEPTN